MVTRPPYAHSEGLRQTLVRLHEAGAGAWRDDHEASELMKFTIEKYGALARKHHLEPADAAVAAFDVMRTRTARTANDPWALVTRAVQVTLIADERANGLLCSTHQARRATVSIHHDAERFSDRETPITDYHPAFRVPAEQDDLDLDSPAGHDSEAPTSALAAVDDAVALFIVLGWPAETSRAGLDYICARLIEAGTRARAHESLRRDRHARALLDLDQRSWIAMLRVVLGNQHPDRVHTSAGRGLLVRLLIGHRPVELLADDELVLAISMAAPSTAGSTHA